MDQARVLLAYLVALDPRLRASDEGTAAIRTKAWAKLLDEVDPGYAMRFVELAYSEPREWALQPAEILQGWRTAQADARTAEETLWREKYPDRRKSSAVMQAYIRKVWAAIQGGKSFDTVPRPVGLVVQLSPEADARERRCVYHRICACEHIQCRDGLLDEEVVLVNGLGVSYPAVKRCPFCNDALLMAEERGLAKRPGVGVRRRR